MSQHSLKEKSNSRTHAQEGSSLLPPKSKIPSARPPLFSLPRFQSPRTCSENAAVFPFSRLLVVTNASSTHASRVRTEVLDLLLNPLRLSDELGLEKVRVARHEISSKIFEESVENLARIVGNFDLIISAGGDSTAAVCANAIQSLENEFLATHANLANFASEPHANPPLKTHANSVPKIRTSFTQPREKSSPALFVLPYGNFNDLAHTLGTKSLADLPKTEIANLYPLEIYVNGEFFRFATCYLSLGLTASAVEIFDDVKTRTRLMKKRRPHLSSYLSLAHWYFKNQKSFRSAPTFFLQTIPASNRCKNYNENREKDVKNCCKNYNSSAAFTDFFATNSTHLASVMKGRPYWPDPDLFGAGAFRLAHLPGLISFMSKSIVTSVPTDPVRQVELSFNPPATITLQIEGEARTFKNCKSVTVKKSSRPLKVLQRPEKIQPYHS